MAALRQPEPGTFESHLRGFRLRLDRAVRLSRRPDSEPYWSTVAGRFDGPDPSEPDSFGVLYLADYVATAFSESVIHECSRYVSGRYEVPLAELTARSVVHYDLKRPAPKTLLLADLTGDALKALGLNNDISATDDYTTPQAWARAIHAADTKWDGIRYVSRQRNDCYCYAVFERAGLVAGPRHPLTATQLSALREKFNVVEV